MTTHNQTNYFLLYNFLVSCITPSSIDRQPPSTTSLDYGFDFDEEELASELLDPQSAGLVDQPVHPVAADEFEMLYRWFIS